MIKIAACTCVHEYQDEEYGKGQRVHNKMEGKVEAYRCTVCGKEK